MAKQYELTEKQWHRISELLPGKAGDPGRTGTENHLFVNGVLWVLRSGAHWHDLPERGGKWKTAHKRFTRWAKAGVSMAAGVHRRRPHGPPVRPRHEPGRPRQRSAPADQ